MRNERTKTDSELKAILKKLDEDELHGLRFGLLPADKIEPGSLTGKDTARLMTLSPKESF